MSENKLECSSVTLTDRSVRKNWPRQNDLGYLTPLSAKKEKVYYVVTREKI
jgi:hypothetical protein